MKKAISILLAIMMVLTALPLGSLSAFAETSGDFEYSVLSETDKTCEITGYTGSATELAIPSEIDGYTVTSIGDWAFFNCTSLTSVIIPDSVTSIEQSAFSYSDSLTSVTIPDSVTSIGRGAFEGCTSLTSATIPDSVTSIEYRVFAFCTSLTAISVQSGNTAYSSADGILFNKDETELVCYPAGKTDDTYTVPDSVTSIGWYAFASCTSLTSVTIPDSVTSIGEYAFGDCTSLTSVTIPDSVTDVGGAAFYNCTSLTSITIPNSVTSIGKAAFKDCTSLTSITIPNSVTSIETMAFDGCTSLTSVTIPDSVTRIGEYAFFGCTSLASVTIPDGVTSIGWDTFSGCTSLTSVTIPNSVTSIGSGAFEGCTSLTAISVHSGNTAYSSADGILFNKDKTELVCFPAGKTDDTYTVPNSVTSIGTGAFYGCTSLTSVTIPDSVTSIGWEAFFGCASLTSVTIPDSVTSIEDWAFGDCTSLTSVTIPNSLTSIGEGAFYGCTSLTSVTIPDSVTSIGSDAFGYYRDEDVNETLKVDGFTIHGVKGSAAETYATENGFAFDPIRVFEDTDSGISVTVTNADALAENTVLKVEILNKTDSQTTYNITLVSNGAEVQPASEVTVKIPVPTTMNSSSCKVYRQEADGSLTNMRAVYQDGYMVFTTDHFSVYVLTSENLTGLLGDIDGNGEVDDWDSVLLDRYLAGWDVEIDTAVADMDESGDVDDWDSVLLARKLAGWDA